MAWKAAASQLMVQFGIRNIRVEWSPKGVVEPSSKQPPIPKGWDDSGLEASMKIIPKG